jgi:hypothetical protein
MRGLKEVWVTRGMTLVEILVSVSVLLITSLVLSKGYHYLATQRSHLETIYKGISIYNNVLEALMDKRNYHKINVQPRFRSGNIGSVVFPLKMIDQDNPAVLQFKIGEPLYFNEKLEKVESPEQATFGVATKFTRKNYGSPENLSVYIALRVFFLKATIPPLGPRLQTGSSSFLDFGEADFSLLIPSHLYSGLTEADDDKKVQGISQCSENGSIAFHGIYSYTGAGVCIKKSSFVLPNKSFRVETSFDPFNPSRFNETPALNFKFLNFRRCLRREDYVFNHINTEAFDPRSSGRVVHVFEFKKQVPYSPKFPKVARNTVKAYCPAQKYRPTRSGGICSRSQIPHIVSYPCPDKDGNIIDCDGSCGAGAYNETVTNTEVTCTFTPPTDCTDGSSLNEILTINSGDSDCILTEPETVEGCE